MIVLVNISCNLILFISMNVCVTGWVKVADKKAWHRGFLGKRTNMLTAWLSAVPHVDFCPTFPVILRKLSSFIMPHLQTAAISVKLKLTSTLSLLLATVGEAHWMCYSVNFSSLNLHHASICVVLDQTHSARLWHVKIATTSLHSDLFKFSSSCMCIFLNYTPRLWDFRSH